MASSAGNAVNRCTRNNLYARLLGRLVRVPLRRRGGGQPPPNASTRTRRVPRPQQRRVAGSHSNAHPQNTKTPLLREASGAARPSPKAPPETKLQARPSLRTPLLSVSTCARLIYSLSRERADARRQPPVTLDGRPAAYRRPQKSPGPRRAPAPRSGQPKGARAR